MVTPVSEITRQSVDTDSKRKEMVLMYSAYEDVPMRIVVEEIINIGS